jgi:type VI secretion system secreted protein Hcp
MATNSCMIFQDQDKSFLVSESQVALPHGSIGIPEAKDFADAASKNGLFQIEDYSFDVVQTLNIGSQSTGAGAGKVTFNPFSITRKVDRASPKFFEKACSGVPFLAAQLGLRKEASGSGSGPFFLVFKFKLVAVKSVSWSQSDGSPKETLTFDYGGLQIFYGPQKADGSMFATVAGGWNRVQNKQDLIDTLIQ